MFSQFFSVFINRLPIDMKSVFFCEILIQTDFRSNYFRWKPIHKSICFAFEPKKCGPSRSRNVFLVFLVLYI